MIFITGNGRDMEVFIPVYVKRRRDLRKRGKKIPSGGRERIPICFPEDSRYFFEKTPDASWEFLYLHFEEAQPEYLWKSFEAFARI